MTGRETVALLAGVVATYIAYLSVWGDDTLYHDAARYWELGASHGRDGGFSLYPEPDRIRGYAFPLACYGLQLVASAMHLPEAAAIDVSGALLAALVGVVVLPRLALLLFPGVLVTWRRVLALNVLAFVFWRGHFDFPLTDFPAVLLAALGILALFRATPTMFLAAGVCLGLAANMRPVYMPALVAAAGAAAVVAVGPGLRARRVLAVALVLQGAMIALLPQLAINLHYYDRWSIGGYSDRQVVREQIFTYGLQAQKHETYVGPSDLYPSAHVTYISPLTTDALRLEHPDGIGGYRAYASFALRHPLEFVGNLGLSLFNGLDVQYPTPYIADLHDRSQVLPLVNYAILFLALARLTLPRARHALGPINWLGLALIGLLGAASVPSAMEPRYLLGVTLLAYCLVCFGPDTRVVLWERNTRGRAALGGACIAFVLACSALSWQARSQLEYTLTLADLMLA